MATFDYSRFYGDLMPLADALREGEARCWNDRLPRDGTEHEYLLYLGCNVLRTVNLAESIVAVLQAMEVDFVTLGGPATCCGIPYHNNGDAEPAARILRHTTTIFNRRRARKVLAYCPSCHFRMGNAARPQFGLEVPVQHVTEFIAENLHRLRFTHPVRRRVALHAHLTSPQQSKDAENTRRILNAIPELAVTDLPEAGDWGRHCASTVIEALGENRFRAVIADQFAEAKRQGQHHIVTVYHSCYRAWCDREPSEGPSLINYVQLVLEGLGLAPFPETYKRFKLAADPAGALCEVGPRAEGRGVNRARLEKTLHSHFAPPER